MVFISAIVKTLGHELVAGDARHGGEHALIMNAARAQLRDNHVLPLRSKSIALTLRIHARKQNSAEKFFFALFALSLRSLRSKENPEESLHSHRFRRRIRTSKLTTPF